MILRSLTGSCIYANTGTPVLYDRAQQHQQQRRYAMALQDYQTYLASNPFNVYKRLARTRVAVLQRGLKNGQDAGLELYMNALQQREKANYVLAILSISQLLSDHPNSAFVDDARYLRAYIELMDRFDYEQALNRLQQLTSSTEKSRYTDTATYSQAIAFEQLGKPIEARKVFVTLRNRHSAINLPWLDLQLPKGNYQSRFWFERAQQRITSIDQFSNLATHKSALLGADFGLAVGARYSYDQPVGSGKRYTYTSQLLKKHRIPATHITHWYTRSTNWNWESSAAFKAASVAGFTPVISHWWFGDEISPKFVRAQRDAYMQNIQQRLIPLLQAMPDAIVLLEPEFNKQGIQHWPQWDNVAAQAISAIKVAAPHVKVGLTIGDWANFENASSLKNIAQSVELSDFVGFMLMTSADNESADLNPVWSIRERAQRAAHSLHKRYNKPLYFGYMALSSASNWRARQAEYVRQMLDFSPVLAAYGVFGMGYFSLFDNPRQQGWFGNAENHFGLLDANAQDKPAAQAWRLGARALMAADTVAPAITKKPLLTADPVEPQLQRISAEFNEWVQWQLTLRGRHSGAIKQFRGAGNQLLVNWYGTADTQEFGNEPITLGLKISDKGGNTHLYDSVFSHQCQPDCEFASQKLTLNKKTVATAVARHGANMSITGQVANIEFPTPHSGMILPLPNWDLQPRDQLRFDIKLSGNGHGLVVGLIDANHYQVDLPLEAYLTPAATNNWRSVTIALTDFPDNAKRYGHKGQQVQFGQLLLNQDTRLILHQRNIADSIKLKNVRLQKRPNQTGKRMLGTHNDAIY